MPWPKGKRVSQETRDKISQSSKGKRRGADNPAWLGGETIDTTGYVLVRMQDHPDAMMNGYIRKHRLIMERHINRRLKKAEHIHHKNGDRLDNSVENLEIITAADHQRLHHVGAKRTPETRRRISEKMTAIYSTPEGRKTQRRRATKN